MAKYYLDEPGLERLVAYIQDELSNKVNKGDQVVLPNDLVYEADLEDYAKKSDIPEGQDLSEYAKSADFADVVREADLADYATVASLDDYATNNDLESLRGEVTGVYHFRGNVANLEALQEIEDPVEGDVYNIVDTGMNAAWNGEIWDEFGTTVDLSDYALSEDIQAMSIPTVEAILYGGTRAVVSNVNSIKAMIANDEPEVEVVLNKDMAGASMVTVPTGKKVTFDLGGNKLSGSTYLVNVTGGEVVLKNGEVESTGRPVICSNGGTVTLDGAEISSTNDVAVSVSGENSEVVVNSGKISAQESGILVTSGGAITLNGGEIECTDNCPIQGNGTAGQGNVNVVMNGGKLTAHITTSGYIACGVYMPNDGSFTMNGGEIESDGAGIVMRGGQVNLNGGSVVANGATGVKGKVGDSRVVVGPYAVVYDAQSKYPAMDSLELNIANGMILEGTDGDIDYVLQDGVIANVTDNR